MNDSFFKTKISFSEIVQEEGKKPKKRVTRLVFLIRCLTFAEAEFTALMALPSNVNVGLASAVRSKITEVVEVGDTDEWWEAKLAMMTEDDQGNPKVSHLHLAINALGIDAALFVIKKWLKDSVFDAEIIDMKKSDMHQVLTFVDPEAEAKTETTPTVAVERDEEE